MCLPARLPLREGNTHSLESGENLPARFARSRSISRARSDIATARSPLRFVFPPRMWISFDVKSTRSQGTRGGVVGTHPGICDQKISVAKVPGRFGENDRLFVRFDKAVPLDRSLWHRIQ